jgi:hypothetical protein
LPAKLRREVALAYTGVAYQSYDSTLLRLRADQASVQLRQGLSSAD